MHQPKQSTARGDLLNPPLSFEFSPVFFFFLSLWPAALVFSIVIPKPYYAFLTNFSYEHLIPQRRNEGVRLKGNQSLSSRQLQKKDECGDKSLLWLRDVANITLTGDDIQKYKMIGNFMLIGIIAIAVIIVIFALWYLLKRKSEEVPQKENHAVHSVSVSEALMLEENDCKEIPIKEIYAATNDLNIHNFIGQGVAGKVYKGVLSNGWQVAIKHIVKDGQAETFLREVTSLSHVRHPNLVILRGYCEKEYECFLVYELCGNGSLSEWLFGREKVLSWRQRLKIAIGSARGLYFLHTFEGGCIVHRDIKPTNILLDDNFEAKLSDFGLSKLIELGVSHVSSEVRGTFGYVDPEYRQNHHVKAAGDVYSFGMVLFQIISGKRVISLDITMPASLDKMAKALMNGGNSLKFVDPRMNGEFSMEAFNLVLKVAVACTAHKRQRPSMAEVVKKLEAALEVSARNTDAFSVSFA